MRFRILSVFLILALSACNTIKLEAAITVAPTTTFVPVETATPVFIPTQAITSTPTRTPLPMKTPQPTATPNLTATQVRQATQAAQASMIQFRKELASYDIAVDAGNVALQIQETSSLQLTRDKPVYQVLGEDLLLSNFILKFDVSLDSEDGLAGCGLAFRAANDVQKGAQYDFVARQTTHGPAWAIEYRNQGKLERYVSGKVLASDQISFTPGSTDTLVLVAQGRKISAYANGSLLGSYENNQRGKGKLALAGFLESGQAACSFSDLWVWALPENGIHGWVTDNGMPAGNIKVSLEKWDGKESQDIASTRTDAYGLYTFDDAPALTGEQEYFVLYQNRTDSSRLWSWATNSISEYEANESVHIGDFDIANLEIILPEDREEISLPYTFQWIPRPNSPMDGYQINIFDPDDELKEFLSFPVVKYAGEFILKHMPPGFSNGEVYYWVVRIVGKDGGYGWSFQTNRLIIQDRNSG
jgi:hypothetical protein